MAKILKINYDGDIRRHAMEEITYDSVVKMVTESFPDIIMSELQMKYADEEGDMCTLVPLTFSDFLTTQSGSKTLKIQVGKKTPPCSASPCASTDDTFKGDNMPEKETTKVDDGSKDVDTENGGQDGCDWDPWGHGSRWHGGRHGHGHRHSHGHGGCGGAHKWLGVIKALKEDGVLNPKILASLFVQWLPMIIQKVTRKLDAINHTVKEGMTANMTNFILVLQHHVETVPALEVFAAQFNAILGQGPNAPLLGDTLRSLLITLQTLPFEVQVNFVEQLSESLFPLLDDLIADLPQKDARPWWMQGATVHHGVTCDHCEVNPIAGPRFKCTTCPNYDLCGNCFTQRMSFHGPVTPDAAPHEFSCIMTPSFDWGKGCTDWGKGCKGWGKGDKGWGKGDKGFGKGLKGKGHFFHHLVPFLHGMMGGAGFKGWGKGGHMYGHPQEWASTSENTTNDSPQNNDSPPSYNGYSCSAQP